MADASHPVTSLFERLENCYDFQCEGGPLKNCVEWQQLKAMLAASSGDAGAPPKTQRSCLYCEGHGTVRHYINVAGNYEVEHCSECGGTGKEAPHV